MFYVVLRFSDFLGEHTIRSVYVASLDSCHHFVFTCIENFAISRGNYTIFEYSDNKGGYIRHSENRF